MTPSFSPSYADVSPAYTESPAYPEVSPAYEPGLNSGESNGSFQLNTPEGTPSFQPTTPSFEPNTPLGTPPMEQSGGFNGVEGFHGGLGGVIDPSLMTDTAAYTPIVFDTIKKEEEPSSILDIEVEKPPEEESSSNDTSSSSSSSSSPGETKSISITTNTM